MASEADKERARHLIGLGYARTHIETHRKRDHSRSKPRRPKERRPRQYSREIDAGAAVPALGHQLTSDEDRATRNPAPKHAHNQQRIRSIDAARHLRGEPPPLRIAGIRKKCGSN